jgi:hypothetical protein
MKPKRPSLDTGDDDGHKKNVENVGYNVTL